MIIAIKFEKFKEYLPNIFKTITLILSYENLIYLDE